jgi:hypothetical protein
MNYKQKYLKYKNKYFIAKNNNLFDQQLKDGFINKNLTNLLGGLGSDDEKIDLPNITINDINFRLVGYNLKNDVIDKDALKIISTLPLKNKTTFYFLTQ